MTEINLAATVVQGEGVLFVELRTLGATVSSATITLRSGATVSEADELVSLLNHLGVGMRVVQDRGRPLHVPNPGIV